MGKKPQQQQQQKKKNSSNESKVASAVDGLSKAYSVVRGVGIFLLGVLFLIYMRHGGGVRFPGSGTLLANATNHNVPIEVVVSLQRPPGNLAVDPSSGRVFFSYHPDGYNDPFVGSSTALHHEGAEADPSSSATYAKVAEFNPATGRVTPFPSLEKQTELFETVLGVRLETNVNRSPATKPSTWLWTLDFGLHGVRQPRLMAFDIDTKQIVHDHKFASQEHGGWGSMLNDFVIDSKRGKIYIADASIFRKSPAIVIYDIQTQRAVRVLENDASTFTKPYNFHINGTAEKEGRRMVILGVFAIRPNVDSIALDGQAEWLYFAAMTDPVLHRVRVADLLDASITPSQLSAKVEDFANKTVSDGIVIDYDGNVLLSDVEYSTVYRIRTDRKKDAVDVLAKDESLIHWGDGFSLGNAAKREVYLTCSSLDDVILRTNKQIESQAPYRILKFKLPQ